MLWPRSFCVGREYFYHQACLRLKFGDFKSADNSRVVTYTSGNSSSSKPPCKKPIMRYDSHGLHRHGTVSYMAIQLQQQRFFHLPNPFRKRQNFRLFDNIPDNFELVYNTSSLSFYITYGYPIIASTVAAAFGFLVSSISGDVTVITSDYFSTPTTQLELFAVFPLVGLMYFLTRIVTHRCPLRIYYNEEDGKFVAIFATLLPWKVRKLEFFSGDVRRIYEEEEKEETNTLNLFRGEYILGKKRLAIFSHFFRYPYHYNIMLGYEWKE